MDDIGIRFANFGYNFFVKVNDILSVFPTTFKFARELLSNAEDLGTCLKATNTRKINTLILLADGRVVTSSMGPLAVIQRINEAITTPANELPVRSSYAKKIDDMDALSDDDPDDDESGSFVYEEPIDPAADLDDDEVELPKHRGRRKKDASRGYSLRDPVYMDQ